MPETSKSIRRRVDEDTILFSFLFTYSIYMKRLKILFWVLGLAIVCAFFSLYLLSKKVNPILLRYSTVEAKRFGVYAVNSAIDQEFLKKIDNNIFDVTFNEKNEIQMIDFRAKEVNQLLKQTTIKVQKRLVDLENGKTDQLEIANTFKGIKFKEIKKGVVCEVPMGALFSNSIVANNGPIFPIKLNFIGEVVTNLKTKVETYGINSIYLEVSIHVEVEERITMPQFTDSSKIQVDIPLTVKVIQGSIPNYYLSSLEKDSSLFSLPIE